MLPSNLKRLALASGLLLLLSTARAQPSPQVEPAATTDVNRVRWKCNAFYLPARSIWQRSIAIEINASGVRAVEIDGVVVYAFNVDGTTVLTSIDSERIQFDSAAQTWISDLRGIVSSQGRCERQL